MSVTKTENTIIEHLRKLRIATKTDLCSTFQVSHMTIVRALKKYGYYTNYNRNSAYYVLKDTPKFDAYGLWLYKDVYFSRYGTLSETLMTLVQMSPSGFAVKELELKLRVKVGNLLSRLCRQKCLDRFYTGRQVVYLSINPQHRSSQQVRRQRQIEEARSLIDAKRREEEKLPKGFDAITVISILIQMIKAPNSSVASISQTLQKKKLQITAEQVRNVIEFYSLQKKNGTLEVAKLVNNLREDFRAQVEEKSRLPLEAKYSFDFFSSDRPKSNLPLHKTMHRTVISLNFSKFQAREIIREEKKEDKTVNHRSPELMAMVPSGARYAYDLIAFVGEKVFLEGQKLTDIHKKLPNIPYSSLYDIQGKFLFYYGALHRKAAPQLKEYLHKRGNITWLIDGTLEPGTPVFFGVKDALEGILLGCWKIPTENDQDISSSLKDCAEQYGNPNKILHDLSKRMSAGCESAIPGVPHAVCHYHFAGAVGEELYKVPQELISKRLRAVKLQVRLKDQRSGQTQYLKKRIESNGISLVLSDLLNGKTIDVKCVETLGREVLLALHLWMLDYPQDGHRQGYPFDPFLLYFHRRIVKAYEASKRLLSMVTIRKNNLRVLVNFSSQLEKYLTDSIIVEASSLYEKAYDIFGRIRDVLRLICKEPNPMHGLYKLQHGEQNQVKDALHELRIKFDKENQNSINPKEKNFYETALKYIDKYGPYLAPAIPASNTGEMLERTTNGIEMHWNLTKRIRRQTHGRKKLTRDFYALPEEFMLVPNLQNPKYIEVVLGSFEKLPEKLAEAGKNAGPYSHWCKQKNPLNVGRLPNRLLRNENFIDDLIGIFDTSCYCN